MRFLLELKIMIGSNSKNLSPNIIHWPFGTSCHFFAFILAVNNFRGKFSQSLFQSLSTSRIFCSLSGSITWYLIGTTGKSRNENVSNITYTPKIVGFSSVNRYEE